MFLSSPERCVSSLTYTDPNPNPLSIDQGAEKMHQWGRSALAVSMDGGLKRKPLLGWDPATRAQGKTCFSID